jgi:hypothetical protein
MDPLYPPSPPPSLKRPPHARLARLAPAAAEFEETALELGPDTMFSPRYFVYEGDPAWQLGNMCTHNGKYCMPDPDQNDPQHSLHLSGADVVMENVRQLCIWQQANVTYAADQGAKWWLYQRLFAAKCKYTDPAIDSTVSGVARRRLRAARLGGHMLAARLPACARCSLACAPPPMRSLARPQTLPACSRTQQAAAGLDTAAVAACVTASEAGAGDTSTLLAKEIADRKKYAIVIIPTIVVNGVVERGGLSQQAVLNTICAGFATGTAPTVCSCILGTAQAISDCVHNVHTNGVVPGSAGGVPMGTVVGVVAAVVLVMSLVGALAYRRAQTQMRQQVRNILAEYMPLDDAPGHSTGVSDELRSTRRAAELDRTAML